MKLTQPTAEIYFPNPSETRLQNTTHLGIGAHEDDLEILAIHGILTAYQDLDSYFTGVTITDGRGAPRAGRYAKMSNDKLWEIRVAEQKAAADIGHYLAQILLNYASQDVKDPQRQEVLDDIKEIIRTTQPSYIYTHSLSDKHDTHVAVALAVIQALREIPILPVGFKVYGCEVWRGLDWLPDDRKIVLDVSALPELQLALLNVYDSQIAGGKRYDLAAIGRRTANATYYQSHQTDIAQQMIYATDLTPLIQDPSLDISGFVTDDIRALLKDVTDRLSRLEAGSD